MHLVEIEVAIRAAEMRRIVLGDECTLPGHHLAHRADAQSQAP